MMKFAVSCSLAFVVLLVASTTSAQPKISFKSRELQEGRNFIKNQIAIPTVSEASGTIDYSFKIDLPPGRGVTPRVELQYSSSGRLSDYGWGWELTLPTIERSQRNGVVDYASNLFTFREGHSTHDLLPTGVTTPLGALEYRERVEKTFNRYLWYQASNQWRVLTTNGVRYELGVTNAGRRGKAVGTAAGTAEWMVTRQIDSKQNYASYEYEARTGRNMFVKTIRYGGNAGTSLTPLWTVTFAWSTASVKAIDYRSGYTQYFGADQLSSILVTIPQHSVPNNTPALVPTSSPTARSYYLRILQYERGD